MAANILSVLFAEKYDEWQERVPKLIAGDIEVLTKVLEDHHTGENLMTSLNSRSALSMSSNKLYEVTRACVSVRDCNDVHLRFTNLPQVSQAGVPSLPSFQLSPSSILKVKPC